MFDSWIKKLKYVNVVLQTKCLNINDKVFIVMNIEKKMISKDKILEEIASGLGIVGAFLVAISESTALVGFTIFTISNVFFIYWGIRTEHKGILRMQIVFVFINIIGITSRVFF